MKDFEVVTATTLEEVKQLGMAGWVKYDEMTLNGTQIHFYKKPEGSQIFSIRINAEGIE
jgi:hypothetical protein